ncbi:fused MFS/spermidine synthase [Psychrobacter sp.]|uniref:fused MFS/spermidine synthase n=1 Tax=Psychrobacter sp. TaxID=56811 RepID=UPI003562E227
MPYKHYIYIVSFFGGFLSLSQEIIWMRLISFVGMSVPQTFAYTLALFLFGIALGAQVGKNICKKRVEIDISLLGVVLAVAAIVDIAMIAGLYFYSATYGVSIILLGLMTLICAAVRGVAFPLVHHVGAADKKTGTQVSNVYFANVFGSTLAPLLIGFVALDYMNTQQVYLLVCALTVLVALFCFKSVKVKAILLVMSMAIFITLWIPEKIFHELSKDSHNENQYPSQLIENKYGFIQVYDDEQDKVVFGANVYDGKLNTDIFHNSNGIDRAYLLTAIKPQAKTALIVGLSTGSWVQVLTSMPSLEKITIIEINPAYVDFIKQHPEVSELLADDRVEIIFTDGRKYLKQHQDKNYDIILMNTTWHWRAYVSNLLSADFLSIIKQALAKDGVVYYNTTQSLDAYYTAQSVYDYVYKYKFFILGSNQPVVLNQTMIKNNLCQLKNYKTKQPVFSTQEKCVQAAEVIMSNPLLLYKNIDMTEMGRAPRIITDNNMITEYKYGKGL